MSEHASSSQEIQRWIDRLHAGDLEARSGLIACACERFNRLTRKMLRSYPRMKRWEGTDDVLQNAAMRLYRALAEVRPANAAEFFRLASLNIRRELLDLLKHHYGPRQHGAHHQTWHDDPNRSSPAPVPEPRPDDNDDPAQLALWTDFHRYIETLPADERELFDLLWYQGLPQAEVADLLQTTVRTVKRRWREVKLKVHDALQGQLPDL